MSEKLLNEIFSYHHPLLNASLTISSSTRTSLMNINHPFEGILHQLPSLNSEHDVRYSLEFEKSGLWYMLVEKVIIPISTCKIIYKIDKFSLIEMEKIAVFEAFNTQIGRSFYVYENGFPAKKLNVVCKGADIEIDLNGHNERDLTVEWINSKINVIKP